MTTRALELSPTAQEIWKLHQAKLNTSEIIRKLREERGVSRQVYYTAMRQINAYNRSDPIRHQYNTRILARYEAKLRFIDIKISKAIDNQDENSVRFWDSKEQDCLRQFTDYLLKVGMLQSVGEKMELNVTNVHQTEQELFEKYIRPKLITQKKE